MATKRGHRINNERPPEFGWLQLVNRTVFLRATIIAVVIGSVLTLINQTGWTAGRESLQLLPLILVFLTPFAVVIIAQVAGVRQAHIDSSGHGGPRETRKLFSHRSLTRDSSKSRGDRAGFWERERSNNPS